MIVQKSTATCPMLFFPFPTKASIVENFVTVKTNCFCATLMTINRAPKEYQKKTDMYSLKPEDDSVQLLFTYSHCYITLQYTLSC